MANQTELTKFRKKKGLTLNAAASLFGVAKRTVIRWEQGDTPIPTKRLADIERLTGVHRSKLRPDIWGTR